MEENSQPPAETVAVQPAAQQPLKPHRGTVILVLGIVGLAVGLPGWFCCGIFGIAGCVCGIIAWVMANKDLKEMDAGTMDASGRGSTKAGKICGIISVILAIVGLVIALIALIFGLGMSWCTVRPISG